MKTSIVLFAACALVSTRLFAADLAPADKEFLAKYEPVRAALAADHLADAKKAAGAIGADPDAQKLAAAGDLKAARAAFAGLSARAIKLGGKTPGFYVVHCPMANKDWLQTSKSISNPYEGKEMSTCGVVRE